jgi:hypothetical protein
MIMQSMYTAALILCKLQCKTSFKPLKSKRERERERARREKWVGSAVTAFNGGYRAKFTAMKIPRQYPLVLLVEVRCREG